MGEIIIEAKNIGKNFHYVEKKGGVFGTIKSLFSREYREIVAMSDINLTMEKGEMIAVIGRNGAGKTTLLKCLSGILLPDEGDISVLGSVPSKREREFLKNISLVMGNKNQLWWDLPPVDSFELHRRIYQIPYPDFQKRLSELMDLLEVENISRIQARKLSLGERMKCELLLSLLHNPQLLFLDEPTIGLDIIAQKKIRNFFKEYNSIYKTSVILTSHYMEDVQDLCKRIIIIEGGKKVYDGSLNNLIKRYIDYKTILLKFSKKIKRLDLQKYGEIIQFDSESALLKVARADVTKVAAHILERFPVTDLDIGERALEDIVSEVFSR